MDSDEGSEKQVAWAETFQFPCGNKVDSDGKSRAPSIAGQPASSFNSLAGIRWILTPYMRILHQMSRAEFQFPCGNKVDSDTAGNVRKRETVPPDAEVVFQFPCGNKVDSDTTLASQLRYVVLEWFQFPCGNKVDSDRSISHRPAAALWFQFPCGNKVDSDAGYRADGDRSG